MLAGIREVLIITGAEELFHWAKAFRPLTAATDQQKILSSFYNDLPRIKSLKAHAHGQILFEAGGGDEMVASITSEAGETRFGMIQESGAHQRAIQARLINTTILSRAELERATRTMNSPQKGKCIYRLPLN